MLILCCGISNWSKNLYVKRKYETGNRCLQMLFMCIRYNCNMFLFCRSFDIPLYPLLLLTCKLTSYLSTCSTCFTAFVFLLLFWVNSVGRSADSQRRDYFSIEVVVLWCWSLSPVLGLFEIVACRCFSSEVSQILDFNTLFGWWLCIILFVWI